MNHAANSSDQACTPGRESGRRFFNKSCLHQALRVSLVITLATGLFHLLNLVDTGRAGFGPALITFFRASFIISWLLLLAGWAAGRRLPRLDHFDAVIMLMAAVFIFRGSFTPETFVTTVNLVVTGAGIFFLVRFGVRNAADVRLTLITLAGAALIISFFGLIEYIFKSNPLFDAIQVNAIGIDTRISASDAFYRIRSLVGHPGYVGAILLGTAPLVLLVLWRRRLLAELALLFMAICLFFTFSRGSWIIGALVLLPIVAYMERHHLRRNFKWLLPIVLVPVVIIAFDYLDREEVSAGFGEATFEKGLHRASNTDGQVMVTGGETAGIQPRNKFIYFDVSDEFYYGEQGPVTVIIKYYDDGLGAVHIEYDSNNENASIKSGAYAPTPSIVKTDLRQWTTAAFYLENPRFEGRQNAHSDFRIVDDDSQMTLREVTVQKGRLKLPSIVAQQWTSRPDSVSTRAGFIPFAWEVLQENPLGVGLFNTPGTEHHAVDSLPLTWIMEFGWPAFIMLGALIIAVALECWRAWKEPRTPAAVLLLSLVVMLLHGGHLMILYDKPSLVLIAAVAALYANIRPWRREGAVIPFSNEDCMV